MEVSLSVLYCLLHWIQMIKSPRTIFLLCKCLMTVQWSNGILKPFWWIQSQFINIKEPTLLFAQAIQIFHKGYNVKMVIIVDYNQKCFRNINRFYKIKLFFFFLLKFPLLRYSQKLKNICDMLEKESILTA